MCASTATIMCAQRYAPASEPTGPPTMRTLLTILAMAIWHTAAAAGSAMGVAKKAVWAPASAEDASALLDVLDARRVSRDARSDGLRSDGRHTFLLFTSSSPRCGTCKAASLHFEQVAVDATDGGAAGTRASGADLLFVELDDQRVVAQPLFTAAGATLGPAVLYVPPRTDARRWFHDGQQDSVRSGVDYIRLRDFVSECSGTRHEHPASWIQLLDAAYEQNPRRWLQRVILMTSRLRGMPSPVQLPDAIRAGMLHYVAKLQANNIAVHSGSSMPFRPNPDHTTGDPLADLLHELAQQDDVRMVGTSSIFDYL